MINYIMFDNHFIDQHIFDYYGPNENKDDDVDVDVDVDNDIDDEIIPHAPEFRDISRSSFIVSYNWALSHRCMLRGSDLEIG